jgi:hypothetical protein
MCQSVSQSVDGDACNKSIHGVGIAQIVCFFAKAGTVQGMSFWGMLLKIAFFSPNKGSRKLSFLSFSMIEAVSRRQEKKAEQAKQGLLCFSLEKRKQSSGDMSRGFAKPT